MTFLALIAIIFFGFAVYNLTCAFVDIPTKKTSQMMMLSRKQQGTKNESVARQSSRERNRLLACKSFAFIHANVHKHCRHFRRG